MEWKPLIGRELWDKVQKTFKVRKSQYGMKFENDILAKLLRTSSGRRLTPYISTGKTAKQYKNTLEKIHISERMILGEFLKIVRQIIIIWSQEYQRVSRVVTWAIIERLWITPEKLIEDYKNADRVLTQEECDELDDILLKPHREALYKLSYLVKDSEQRRAEKQAIKDMMNRNTEMLNLENGIPDEIVDMIAE